MFNQQVRNDMQESLSRLHATPLTEKQKQDALISDVDKMLANRRDKKEQAEIELFVEAIGEANDETLRKIYRAFRSEDALEVGRIICKQQHIYSRTIIQASFSINEAVAAEEIISDLERNGFEMISPDDAVFQWEHDNNKDLLPGSRRLLTDYVDRWLSEQAYFTVK